MPPVIAQGVPPDLQALLEEGDPDAILDWLSRNPNILDQQLLEQMLAAPELQSDPRMQAYATESLERLAPDPAFEAWKREYLEGLQSQAEAEAARTRLRASFERYAEIVRDDNLIDVGADFGSPPPAPRSLTMAEAQARGDELRDLLSRRMSNQYADELSSRVDALEAGETGLPILSYGIVANQFFGSAPGSELDRAISRLRRLLRDAGDDEPRRRVEIASALAVALQASEHSIGDELQQLAGETQSLASAAGLSERDRLAIDVNGSFSECAVDRSLQACIPHIEALMEQARSTLSPNDPVVLAATLNATAMIFQQGRYAEARSNLIDVMNASGGDMSDTQVAFVQLMLATLSVQLGDFDKGVAFLFQAEATAGSDAPQAALAAAEPPPEPTPEQELTPLEALENTLGPEGIALLEQFGVDSSDFLSDLPPETVQLLVQTNELNSRVENPDTDEDELTEDMVSVSEQLGAFAGLEGMGELTRAMRDPTGFAVSREPEDVYEAVEYYIDRLHAMYREQGSTASLIFGDDNVAGGDNAPFNRLLGAWLVGYLPDAAAELTKLAGFTNSMLARNLYSLAFAEQVAFLTDDLPFQTSIVLSLARAGMELESSYGAIIAWKGILADATRRQNAAIQAALEEPEFTDRAQELLQIREELSARLVTGAANQTTVVEALTARKEELERQINERYAAAIGPADPAGLDDLRGVLGDDEVFLDLFRYDVYEAGEYAGTNYGAVVTTAGASPRMVDLGDAESIDAAILDWRDAVLGAARADDADSRSRETAAWERLEAAVWTPIGSVVDWGESPSVVVAPDHELSRVPWSLFADDADIVQVDSARALIDGRRAVAASSTDSVLLVGDVDFGFGGLQLQQLPFTRDEVDLVESIGASQSLTVETLSGADAREEVIKQDLEGVAYAHFATHGLFRSDESSVASSRGFDDAFAIEGASLTRNPLMFSGLAVSDYNYVSADMPSGFLTAEELLGLDLSATELIVLSACNTGRGREATGQGVIGLRSALTTAGAKSVLLSLWSVDDRATLELMRHFYEGLWTMGLSKSQALKRAQSLLRETEEYSAPYYWAAWVLVDAGGSAG